MHSGSGAPHKCVLATGHKDNGSCSDVIVQDGGTGFGRGCGVRQIKPLDLTWPGASLNLSRHLHTDATMSAPRKLRVLLLHGYGMNQHSFRRRIAALKKECRRACA